MDVDPRVSAPPSAADPFAACSRLGERRVKVIRALYAPWRSVVAGSSSSSSSTSGRVDSMLDPAISFFEDAAARRAESRSNPQIQSGHASVELCEECPFVYRTVCDDGTPSGSANVLPFLALAEAWDASSAPGGLFAFPLAIRDAAAGVRKDTGEGATLAAVPPSKNVLELLNALARKVYELRAYLFAQKRDAGTSDGARSSMSPSDAGEPVSLSDAREAVRIFNGIFKLLAPRSRGTKANGKKRIARIGPRATFCHCPFETPEEATEAFDLFLGHLSTTDFFNGLQPGSGCAVACQGYQGSGPEGPNPQLLQAGRNTAEAFDLGLSAGLIGAMLLVALQAQFGPNYAAVKVLRAAQLHSAHLNLVPEVSRAAAAREEAEMAVRDDEARLAELTLLRECRPLSAREILNVLYGRDYGCGCGREREAREQMMEAALRAYAKRGTRAPAFSEKGVDGCGKRQFVLCPWGGGGRGAAPADNAAVPVPPGARTAPAVPVPVSVPVGAAAPLGAAALSQQQQPQPSGGVAAASTGAADAATARTVATPWPRRPGKDPVGSSPPPATGATAEAPVLSSLARRAQEALGACRGKKWLKAEEIVKKAKEIARLYAPPGGGSSSDDVATPSAMAAELELEIKTNGDLSAFVKIPRKSQDKHLFGLREWLVTAAVVARDEVAREESADEPPESADEPPEFADKPPAYPEYAEGAEVFLRCNAPAWWQSDHLLAGMTGAGLCDPDPGKKKNPKKLLSVGLKKKPEVFWAEGRGGGMNQKTWFWLREHGVAPALPPSFPSARDAIRHAMQSLQCDAGAERRVMSANEITQRATFIYKVDWKSKFNEASTRNAISAVSEAAGRGKYYLSNWETIVGKASAVAALAAVATTTSAAGATMTSAAGATTTSAAAAAAAGALAHVAGAAPPHGLQQQQQQQQQRPPAATPAAKGAPAGPEQYSSAAETCLSKMSKHKLLSVLELVNDANARLSTSGSRCTQKGMELSLLEDIGGKGGDTRFFVTLGGLFGLTEWLEPENPASLSTAARDAIDARASKEVNGKLWGTLVSLEKTEKEKATSAENARVAAQSARDVAEKALVDLGSDVGTAEAATLKLLLPLPSSVRKEEAAPAAGAGPGAPSSAAGAGAGASAAGAAGAAGGAGGAAPGAATEATATKGNATKAPTGEESATPNPPLPARRSQPAAPGPPAPSADAAAAPVVAAATESASASAQARPARATGSEKGPLDPAPLPAAASAAAATLRPTS